MGYKKLRRKILVHSTGTEEMCTLYEVYCKWGTQNVCVAYLFDEPREGVITKAIKWSTDNNLRYARQYGVHITHIAEDGLVFLEMF